MPQSAPNKHARLSLVSAIVTVIFFCIGFAPFLPMTALVCYPAALVSGTTALVSGMRGLKQPSGQWMARLGIVTGLVVILAVIVFSVLTALFLPLLAEGLSDLWQSVWP